MLNHYYGCCSSRLTANSARIKHLTEGSDAYESCRADIKEDIASFFHVTEEDKAVMVSDFHASRNQTGLKMKVCAACGLRDPTMKYEEKTLNSLPANHWLVIPPDAYDEKFQNIPTFNLLLRSPNGDLSDKPFTSKDFHNVVVLDFPDPDKHDIAISRAFHIVEEAIRPIEVDGDTDYVIDMCKMCFSCKAFNTQPGPRFETEAADLEFISKSASDKDENDSSDSCDPKISITYYSSSAPANSIAKGMDYGRILHDVLPTPSTLENLILASGRCYSVTIKIVSNGTVTKRKKLRGNTICFPQSFEATRSMSFSAATIAAALTGIHIVFVGPDSERSKMEKVALKIDDLQLRPEVLLNHYRIMFWLHRKQPPPTAQEVTSVIDDFDLPSHIRKYARSYASTALEPRASDVANVRSHAQEDRDLIDDEEKEAIDADDLAPSLIPIGVMPTSDTGILFFL
jgi:hypothetical protein